MAVIVTLADVLDTEPGELDPLYSSVDPDALDAFVRVRNGTNADSHVAFTHEGHTIRVHSDGVVAISPGHEPPAEQTRYGGR